MVHTRQIGTDFQFKVGLNVVSLAHRALAQLPCHHDLSCCEPQVSWRLNSTANTALGRENSHVFTLRSNRHNPEAENPSRFKSYKLRREQLRSLHWMIEQEENPKPWVEEEVTEALVTQLGWTAEVKVTREVLVRGGVVADAVGYGKTAITLGLIASRREADEDLPKDDERIAIKATLIVVPKHLSQQWPDEVKKFTQPALKTILIQNHAHLKKYTIEDFQKADIVIVAESIFTSDVYWPYTADFCASPCDIKTDKRAGRYFRHCVDVAMESLTEQVRRIREEGSRAAHKAIKKARESRDEDFEKDYVIPESRKKAVSIDHAVSPPPRGAALIASCNRTRLHSKMASRSLRCRRSRLRSPALPRLAMTSGTYSRLPPGRTGRRSRDRLSRSFRGLVSSSTSSATPRELPSSASTLAVAAPAGSSPALPPSAISRRSSRTSSALRAKCRTGKQRN